MNIAVVRRGVIVVTKKRAIAIMKTIVSMGTNIAAVAASRSASGFVTRFIRIFAMAVLAAL
ncbi:MAG: hypothetical protein ACK5L0_09520 [Candidatus Fimivivens sp.]